MSSSCTLGLIACDPRDKATREVSEWSLCACLGRTECAGEAVLNWSRGHVGQREVYSVNFARRLVCHRGNDPDDQACVVVELGFVNTFATVSVDVDCGRAGRARPLPDSHEECHWRACSEVGSVNGRPLLNLRPWQIGRGRPSTSGLRSVVFELSDCEKGKVHFCRCSGHWPCCLFLVAGYRPGCLLMHGVRAG